MPNAALAQGKPTMVIAMTTAAITQPNAIHKPPKTIQSRLRRREMRDITMRRPTKTPKACITRFWKLLSAPGPEIWREYRAAAQGPERQRAALELLASVVWHLELSTSLASWPTQKMEQFYLQLLSDQTDALTPWKIWVDHYNRV